MINVREISDTERDYWNSEIQRFDMAHPLNAFEWGAVRSVDGWTPIRLCAERDGKFCGALMILRKRLPFTSFSILYAQKMPAWEYEDDETLAALIQSVARIGKRENAIFFRMNPNITEAQVEGKADKFVGLGLRHLDQRWSFWNSPRDMARIDLTVFDGPDEYFANLPKNTRTATRKSARNGVTLEVAVSKADVREFYDMFREFSLERNFMVRDFAYQEKLWETYLQHGMGRLLLARYEGEVVGGSLDLAFAGKCLGMHGGSLFRYRKLAIDDSTNVAAIQWAKSIGCSWYSFRGLGSTATQGVYKKKFGAVTVPLVGYYDLPFKPLLYWLFYWSEFTMLPASWPLLIRVRKLADQITKVCRKLTGRAPKQ